MALTEVQYAAFQNAVWIDTGSGNSGTTYPTGSRAVPVNNLTDALSIASTEGFNALALLSNLTVPTGTDVSGFTFKGHSKHITTLTLDSNSNTLNCRFEELTISGNLDNNCFILNCIVNALSGFNGYMESCLLNNVTIVLSGSQKTTLKDCYSNVPGGAVTIDLGGSGQALIALGFIGELTLANKTGSDIVDLDILSGELTIESTVTSGSLTVRGSAKLLNNGSATLDMSNLNIPENFYTDGEVFIDPVDGESGQDYPSGLRSFPVDSFADASTIASKYSLNAFAIRGNLTANRDFQKAYLRGVGSVPANILILNSKNYTDAYLYRLSVTGSMVGNNTLFQDCFLNNVSGLSGLIADCGIQGTLTLGGNTFGRNIQMIDDPTYLDFGSAPTSFFQASVESGVLELRNMGPGNVCAITYNNGTIIISDTCTGGTLLIGGSSILIDNSDDAVTIEDKTLLREIPFLVWDEPLTGKLHGVPTTAGRRLRELGGQIIVTGVSEGPAINGNQIILDTEASTLDGAYDPALIAIVAGTGAGQTRGIIQYEGSIRTATVDRTWRVLPDDTSEYVIYAWPGREHVNEGLALGGTSNTITLNAGASSIDGAYIGQTVFIRSGLGSDQSRQVVGYVGTTKLASVNSPWDTVPDTTSGYVMLGNQNHTLAEIYAYQILPGLTVGDALTVIKRLTENKVTRDGDIITIYEEDDVTIWKKFTLANGGRVEVI